MFVKAGPVASSQLIVNEDLDSASMIAKFLLAAPDTTPIFRPCSNETSHRARMEKVVDIDKPSTPPKATLLPVQATIVDRLCTAYSAATSRWVLPSYDDFPWSLPESRITEIFRNP